MVQKTTTFTDTDSASAAAFTYYDVTTLAEMTLEELESIWDLVPTEDRDYLLRRYRKSLKGHRITSDAHEMRLVDEYLHRYQYEGLVPAGNQWVRISTTRRHDLEQGQTDVGEIDDEEGRSLPWMTILVVGFGLFLALFVLSRVLGGRAPDETIALAATPTPILTPTMTLTPSPAPTITPTPTATPIALLDSDRFIAAGDGRKRDWFPVQLQVRRTADTQPRIFIVQERLIDLTEWSFDPNPDVASWVSGTTVRPVFGLPYSAANTAFLNALDTNSEFVIRMNTGSELAYTFATAQELGRESTGLFRQNQPGIVLVLIGETDDQGLPTSSRYFVTGTYNPRFEVNGVAAAALPPLVGETRQLPDLSVTVTDTYVLPVADDPSAEFMLAVVDIQLVGGTHDLNLAGYQWFLETDDMRQSPELSAPDGARYGSMPMLLHAGEEVAVSLAFLVRRFAGDALLLVVPPGNAGNAFRVTFTQPPAAVTAANLIIQLRRIRRSSQQVFVDVRIYNPHAAAITLLPDAIHMIFGFTPQPIGAPSRPLNVEPLVLAAQDTIDVTFTWDWNADDPFARLEIAGRVWTMRLVE